MSIFRTPYDTNQCSGARLEPTKDAIRRSLILGEITYSANAGCYTIEGAGTSLAQIPSFIHPMLVDINGKEELFLDLRSFGTWSQRTGTFVVRAGSAEAYALALGRAAFTRIWLDNPPSMLRDVSPMMTEIFSDWLSQSIAYKFALEPREQLDLAILAGLHFQYLFVEGGKLDEQQHMRVLAAVSKAAKANVRDVEEVMRRIEEPFGDIKSFCDYAQDVTGAIRLQGFTPGILYTALGGTWFGPNAAEIVAVSLEHPPTWLMLLYSAANERGFKNTGIGKRMERQRQQVSKDFVRAVVNLRNVLDHNSPLPV